MAHGEAEHGCAQGEPCRPGHHDQPSGGKHPRWATGVAHPPESVGERVDDEPGRPWGDDGPAWENDLTLPRQRAAEPSLDRRAVPEEAESAGQGCRSELPGWAGGHRHGPVRPRHRAVRRERPPRRWC
ncbi:hypothetical protein GA0070616_1135 [Micromonospora nigra]|uniref:Uncharacterized protein n=1 Tax=Micromonospora nigra TaxID=145857 RepID=A0A1C6RI19_9ACTN|nr:hypothetical protein [Micromonospora nigra]SCL16844.1 hypothetical protein GA0070616_1135 [Micromonospora nigra]